MLFLWLKTLHIVAVVCWFAGLFYLPRLFVYHAMSEDQTSRERFCIMERKLYRGIMNPSLIATLLLGAGLLATNADYYFSQGWMHAKLAAILLLVGYHLACGVQLRQFAGGENPHGHMFFRWFNEVPVLFLLGIVILVVVRPF